MITNDIKPSWKSTKLRIAIIILKSQKALDDNRVI